MTMQTLNTILDCLIIILSGVVVALAFCAVLESTRD